MTGPYSTLAAFEASVERLPDAGAEGVRYRFMSERLDLAKIERAADALTLRSVNGELGYQGYLWDYLVDKRVIDENEIWMRLASVPIVYAMWDVHSDERVLIADYFKFPTGTVLQADPDTFRRGLAFLPEDLYFFDATFDWAAALTHELIDDKRFCLWSGEFPIGVG